MANNRNLKFTFEVDVEAKKAKAEIEDVINSLNKIQQTAYKPNISLQNIEKSRDAAHTLQKALQDAMNVDTGKLNLDKFQQSIAKSGTSFKELRSQLTSIGEDGHRAFYSLAEAISTAEVPAKNVNKLLQETMGTLANSARWQISSSFWHGIIGAIQGAVSYSKELDDSLTSIQVVTQKTDQEMAKFAESANKAATALSTTTNRYAQASLIYFQQGLDAEEVEKRAAITVKMANVTGDTAQTVSQQLTSVWNNFYDGSKSLEYYADGMTALGAATATSSSEIADGLQKFASIGETVGLSYEYAASALATITATTRESADTVGNALKSLFARIEGLQLGDTLEDGTTLNKYSAALAKVGVDIKDANGNLKDMDEILDDLGERWQQLNRDEQVALAQTVAGQRQYAQLMTLMNNWDFMKQNLQTVNSSTGTLQKQADIYAKSWEAASTRVRAHLEEIYAKLVDRDFFTDIENAITLVVDRISDLIDGFGGVGGIISTISSIFISKFADKIPAAISEMGQNLKITLGMAKDSAISLQEEMQKFTDLADDYDVGLSYLYGTDAQEQAKIHRIQEIGKMQLELNNNASQLTEEEKKQYEWEIKKAQILFTQLEAEGERLNKIREETDNMESELAMQAKEPKSSKFNFDDVLTGLRNSTIEAHRLAEAYSGIETNVESWTQGLKNGDLVSEEILTNAKEYAKSLLESKRINEETYNRMEEFLNQDGLKVEDLKGLGDIVENAVSKSNMKLKGFANAMVQTFKLPEEEVEKLVKQYEITDDKLRQYEQHGESLGRGFKDGAKHITTFSEALMSTVSAIASYAGVVASAQRVSDVFTDEDATVVNKITAAVGLLATTINFGKQTLDATSKAMAYVNKIQAEAVAVQAAHTGSMSTFGAVTSVVKSKIDAFTASLMANPLFVGGVAIAATIAAAAVAVDKANKAFEERQESLSKTVEEHEKLYEENKKELDQNNDLILSYEKLLSQYETTKTGKEDLMVAATQVADALGMEGTSVLTLTGQYEKLNEEIYKARQGDLEISREELRKAEEAQGEYIYNEMTKGRGSSGISSQAEYYITDLNGVRLDDKVFKSSDEAYAYLNDLNDRLIKATENYEKAFNYYQDHTNKVYENALKDAENALVAVRKEALLYDGIEKTVTAGAEYYKYLFDFSDGLTGWQELYKDNVQKAVDNVIEINKKAGRDVEISVEQVFGEGQGNLKLLSDGSTKDDFLAVYETVKAWKEEFQNLYKDTEDETAYERSNVYQSVQSWLNDNEEMFKKLEELKDKYKDLDFGFELDRIEAQFLGTLEGGEITSLSQYEELLGKLKDYLKENKIEEEDYDEVLRLKFSHYPNYIELAQQLQAMNDIINEEGITDQEKAFREQAKQYIEENRAEDLGLFAYINFDEVKTIDQLNEVLDKVKAEAQSEDNLVRLQTQLDLLESDKFKNGMSHKELMAYKESSGIDWDSEEAEAVQMSWTQFLYASDDLRKELLDQYYAKVEENIQKEYENKVDRTKAEVELALKEEEELQRQLTQAVENSPGNGELIRSIEEQLADAKLKTIQAQKDAEEAEAELAARVSAEEGQIAYLQQQLATTAHETGDVLTAKQVEALDKLGIKVSDFAVVLDDGTAVLTDKAKQLGAETAVAYYKGLEEGVSINLADIKDLETANALLAEGLINDEQYKDVIKLLDATGELELSFENLANENLLKKALGTEKFKEYKDNMKQADLSTEELIQKMRDGQIPADQFASTLDKIFSDKDTTLQEKIELVLQGLKDGTLTAQEFLDKTKDIFTAEQQLGYILGGGGGELDKETARGQFSALNNLISSGDLDLSETKAALEGMTEAMNALGDADELTAVDMENFYQTSLKVAQMDDQDFTLNQNLEQLQSMLSNGYIDMDRYREGIQQLIESYKDWGMTAEEVYGKLIDIEISTYKNAQALEDNAGALGRQCASMENYQALTASLEKHHASNKAQTLASQAALAKLGSQYDSCSDSLKKLNAAIDSNNDQLKDQAASELKLSIRAEEAAEVYGIEAKQIKTLAKSYQDLAKAGGGAYSAAANNEEIATDLAVRFINLNNGVKDLQENWEDYNEALTELEGSAGSVEAMNSALFDHQDALTGIQAAMAEVLNVSDPTIISFQFLAENAELVRQAMEGDSEAIAELQAKMAEDFILHLDIDDTAFLDTLLGSKQAYLDWINNLPPGELEFNDQQILEQLANLMSQFGYAVDQIEDYFAGCGIDVDFEEVTNELDEIESKAEEVAVNSTNTLANAYQHLRDYLPPIAREIGDKIAEGMGIDTEMTSSKETHEDQGEFQQIEVSTPDVPYSVQVPRYHFSASDSGVTYYADVQDLNMTYKNIVATPKPLVTKDTQTRTATALRVKSANKTVGGNISHTNSTGGNKRTTAERAARSSGSSSPRTTSSTPAHVNAPQIKIHDTKYNERKTIDEYQKDKVRKETPNKKETPEEVTTSKKKYYNERYEKDKTFEEKEYEKKDSSTYLQFDDEIERYHDVTNALENISYKLNEIDQRKSRAFGKSHIDALNEEKVALQEQLKLQEEYISQLGERSAELRSTMEEQGYQFDENGTITNYPAQKQREILARNAGMEQYVENSNLNKYNWNQEAGAAYGNYNSGKRTIYDVMNAAMQKETEKYNKGVEAADKKRNEADKAAVKEYNDTLEKLAVDTKFNADNASNKEYLTTMKSAVSDYNKSVDAAEAAREKALTEAENNRMRDLNYIYNQYQSGNVTKDYYDEIVSTVENAYNNAKDAAENTYSNAMDKAADLFEKTKTKAENKLKESQDDAKEAYEAVLSAASSKLSQRLAQNKKEHQEALQGLQETYDDNVHNIKESMKDAEDALDETLDAAMKSADKTFNDAQEVNELSKEIVENTYDQAEKNRQEYEGIEDTIQQAMYDAQELRNRIYDNALEVIDYTLNLKVRISNEVMTALQAYLDALGDGADKAADRITNLASQMGQFAYQVKETRDSIAELLNSTGNISQSVINRLMNADSASFDDLTALFVGDQFTEAKIAQLESYRDSLVSLINEQRNLKNEMFNNVETAFNEYQESLGTQIDKIVHLTKLTDTYKNIIGIIGKKTLDATGQVSELLARQAFESQRRQTETYSSILKEIDSNLADMKQKQSQYDLDSEMYKDFQDQIDKMEEKRRSAQENWLTSWEAEMQSAADYYANAIETITMVFEQSIAGIIGSIDLLQSEMDRQKQIADVYVEDYEKIYQLNKLNRDIEEALNDTDRVKNKQQLKKLQDQINQASADGVKLSQYDLDVLRKKFELEIAREELEEARNAKSQVRMMRDAEGNYGYVYTADANAVANAEQSYEDKLHELQVLNTEYIKQLEDNYLQLQQNVRDQIANLDITQFATEEEYLAEVTRIQEAALELQKRYGQQMGNAIGNNRDLYENDWATYSRLTGYRISLDEEYLDKFTETQYSVLTGFQSMEEAKEVFAKSLADAIASAVLAYHDTREMQKIAMEDGDTSMKDFATSAAEATSKVGEETQKLANEAEDLSVTYRNAFSEIAEQAGVFAENYVKSIQPVIDANLKLLNIISQIIESQADVENIRSSVTGDSGGTVSGSTASNATWTAFQSQADVIGAKSKIGEYLPYVAALLKRGDYEDNFGGWGDYNQRKARLEEVFGEGAAEDIDNYLAKFGNDVDSYSQAMLLSGTSKKYSYETLRKKIKGYDTGGYTGSWASNLGRLAFLHEKELVLNKEDTANILSAVDMIRSIAQVIDLNARSTSQAMSAAFTASSVQDTSRNFEQTVTINADFPNATDRDEIIAAFDNLTNLAYQLAGQQ